MVHKKLFTCLTHTQAFTHKKILTLNIPPRHSSCSANRGTWACFAFPNPSNPQGFRKSWLMNDLHLKQCSRSPQFVKSSLWSSSCLSRLMKFNERHLTCTCSLYTHDSFVMQIISLVQVLFIFGLKRKTLSRCESEHSTYWINFVGLSLIYEEKLKVWTKCTNVTQFWL